MKLCLLFMGIYMARAFLPLKSSIVPIEPIVSFDKTFDRSWYVVAQANEIKTAKPYKVTVWGKDYVLWKTDKETYNALEDVCPHKGAALSVGYIANDRAVCPYHGYEFSDRGNLTVVPGLCFLPLNSYNGTPQGVPRDIQGQPLPINELNGTPPLGASPISNLHRCKPSPVYNIPRFAVVEKHGWIYLNTHEVPQFVTKEHINMLSERIFVEPEAADPTMTAALLHQTFMTYPRIVSENSLDIMHIAFVHTFGNRAKPAPSHEDPPKEVGTDHWRSSYVYESGKDSMVSRLFRMKRIDIDNEFALPHTTIARIKFGDGWVNTVVTAACPVNERETRLFVKTYRNFFRDSIFNGWFKTMMADTLHQDKAVIESIKNENMDGRFNMKFDKLQNTYRSLYKAVIRKHST